METILIFAGGDPLPQEAVGDLPDEAFVVAADGGYHLAVALGMAVDVVVGDLDSLPAESLPDHVMVHPYPADKDQTDLELALVIAVEQSPARIVVAGGAGGRHDHELATASLLCSDLLAMVDEIDWISSRGRAHVIRGRRRIHGDIGALLSLIPFGGPAIGVSTRGLRWNLNGASIAPGSTWGVSNVMTAPTAEIGLVEGCLLAVLPSVQSPAST